MKQGKKRSTGRTKYTGKKQNFISLVNVRRVFILTINEAMYIAEKTGYAIFGRNLNAHINLEIKK